MQIPSNTIILEAEDHGDASDPAIVLIRGLGSQLIHLPENLVSGLVATGHRVITVDNRDVR